MGRCHILIFFLLIGLGITIVCSSAELSSLDLQLEPYRAQLTSLAPQSHLLQTKMNLGLDLLAASLPSSPGAKQNQAALLRLTRELPAETRQKFLKEIAEIRRQNGELGQAAAEWLAVWNQPAASPTGELISVESTRTTLERLNKIRASRNAACPSQTTTQQWQAKSQSTLNADREARQQSDRQTQTAQAGFKKAEKNALSAERAFMDGRASGKYAEFTKLMRRNDALWNERRRLREQTQKLLSALFPLPKRNSADLANAAFSTVPMFEDYQREAPLWKYSGLDARSSEDKPAAEKYAQLDAPEFQKYFVEPLNEHPEKNFVFTLTEEGKRALGRPFFAIEKVAVHQLAELDAVQQRSRDLFALGQQLRTDEHQWESTHQKLALALRAKLSRKEAGLASLVAANQSLSTAENGQRLAAGQLREDQALNGRLRACADPSLAVNEPARAAKQSPVEATH